MKKILLIATGGTIVSRDVGKGLSPAMDAQALLSAIDIPPHTHVDFVPLANIDSTNVTPSLWEKLCVQIASNWSAYDGFVVTHGTDTMAYTCAALYYMIEHPDKPVVITGSQKPMGTADTDAARNLSDAISTAASSNPGVYGVFCGRIICGKYIRKIHTTDFDGFAAINAQPHDCLSCGTLQFHPIIDQRINVFYLTPAASPYLLRQMGDISDGIILMGVGAGGIPTLTDVYVEILASLEKLKIPVVFCTQVLSGSTNLSAYTVGQKALQYHVMEGGWLTPEATLAAFSLAISQAKDYDETRRLFELFKLK